MNNQQPQTHELYFTEYGDGRLVTFKRMSLAVVAALLLTIGPALLQGSYTNRWQRPPDLSTAGRHLHQLPRQLGPWSNVQDEQPLSDAVCRELGLVEHFHREYVDSSTGKRVSVLLMVGPPGRLVRHPPEICYANRANQQLGPAESIEIVRNASQHHFKLLQFKRTSQPLQSDFRVAYAFGTSEGEWSVPSSPRMSFGALPVLYKLQVLSESTSQENPEELKDFLEDFVESFNAEMKVAEITERANL